VFDELITPQFQKPGITISFVYIYNSGLTFGLRLNSYVRPKIRLSLDKFH